MITYFVLSHFLKVILKKEKLSDFQREATKESNKNETFESLIILIQSDLPGQQFMKGTFHENAIVAKVVVSDCSFLFGCVLWSSSKH